MELSKFLSMVQYEVLKSFDFASTMQINDDDSPEVSRVQLAMESAELEIPLLFETSTKEVKLEELDLDKDHAKNKIDLPFNTVTAIENYRSTSFDKVKAKNKKGVAKGDIVNVTIANAKTKQDSGVDDSLVGKIKLTIKPVLK